MCAHFNEGSLAQFGWSVENKGLLSYVVSFELVGSGEYAYVICLKCIVFQRVVLCEMSPLLHTR